MSTQLTNSFLYYQKMQNFDFDNTTLLSEWLPQYLDEYVKPSCAKNTYANYYSYMNTHIVPLLGTCKLMELTTPLLQQFIADKLHHGRLDGTGGLSVKTVTEILLFLKQALRRATALGMMLFNPCDSVSSPKEIKQEVAFLEVEEQEQLEAVIVPEYQENSPLFIAIALSSGLRIGEICALTQGDIDFTKKQIKVSKTLGRVRMIHKDGSSTYEIHIGCTKNKKQRLIPINQELFQLLHIYMETMPQALKGANLPLFYKQNHQPMEPRTMRYHFHKYIANVGLQHIHFHTLRHTFATRCLEVGIEMKIVSKILGHSSIKITMDLYTHVTQQKMHDSMAKLTHKNWGNTKHNA